MKKQFFYLLTFFFVSQFAWADGATDVPYNDIDTLGRCDEQYFSVIKLKIKRPEAIPFTINAKGGKVEFSTGNLQYQPSTNTFRFATRQWESIGGGDTTGDNRTSSGSVYWDSIGENKIYRVLANNGRISKNYSGWIDLFGWGTSGFNPNAPGLTVRKDPYSLRTKPYSTSSSQVNTSYNTYGYGPSYNYSGVRAHFDTLDKVSRNYDWGYYNYIYCKWVGYDISKEEDLILFDSTIFEPRVWRTLTDAEWKYMLDERRIENKASRSWSYITIAPAIGDEFPGNGGADPLGPKVAVNGLLIFPDDFMLEQAIKFGFNPAEKSKIAYGSVRNFGTATRLSYKSFTALERLGVVFLPVMASRTGTTVRTTHVDYWTSMRYTTNTPATYAAALRFKGNTAGTDGVTNNVFNYVGDVTYVGNSVRLVRDLDITKSPLISAYQ